MLEISLITPEIKYKLKNGKISSSYMIKALGIKKPYNQHIVDCTAGLGVDSLMIASLGCKVTMLERSEMVYKTLKKAIEEAKNDDVLGDIITNIKLVNYCSIKWLEEHKKDKFDAIYLDPMFPKRQKSALVKQGMQNLQEVVGKDEDADLLLKNALNMDVKRVVVKRPKIASELANIKPQHVVLGKSNRFDIYLPNIMYKN